MKIQITNVPQADELNKVLATVEAVNNDYYSDQKIAEYIGFTDRQGRYYRLAAELLGLLTNDQNRATITSLGKEVVVLDDQNRLKKIRELLKKTSPFVELLKFIEDHEDGVTKPEITNFLYSLIDGAQSTIDRRSNTLINWLLSSQLVKYGIKTVNDEDQETAYLLNVEVDEEDAGTSTTNESIYPAKFSDEELDIKESHMQVVTLVRKHQQGKVVVPEFQRNQVWKQQQKSRFIESLILNIPVPPFYISQDLEGNLIVVDGLQRSTAIFEYIFGLYELTGLQALPHLNGITFNVLAEDLKARIEDRELLFYILRPTVPLSIVYDIFNRINSNGSPLTSQEIRNCVFIGKSTKLLAKLAVTQDFLTAIDQGISSLRMKDREAILRFFSFLLLDYRTEYGGNLDDYLGRSMKVINKMTDSAITHLEDQFINSMQKTFEFFGDKNFRIPTENSRGRINLALMDCISYYFAVTPLQYLVHNKDQIISRYNNVLLKDLEFIDSIKNSTNSIKNVNIRFSKTFNILNA